MPSRTLRSSSRVASDGSTMATRCTSLMSTTDFASRLEGEAGSSRPYQSSIGRKGRPFPPCIHTLRSAIHRTAPRPAPGRLRVVSLRLVARSAQDRGQRAGQLAGSRGAAGTAGAASSTGGAGTGGAGGAGASVSSGAGFAASTRIGFGVPAGRERLQHLRVARQGHRSRRRDRASLVGPAGGATGRAVRCSRPGSPRGPHRGTTPPWGRSCRAAT